MQRRGHAGVRAQHSRRALAPGASAGDRRPHVERIERGEFLDVLLREIGEPKQQTLPLRRFEFAPWTVERAPRGGDREVDVVGVALGYVGEQFARRGVTAFEGFARRRFQPFAVDQHPLRLAIEEWMHPCHDIHQLGLLVKVEGGCSAVISSAAPGEPASSSGTANATSKPSRVASLRIRLQAPSVCSSRQSPRGCTTRNVLSGKRSSSADCSMAAMS
jgi:hypothetical protein